MIIFAIVIEAESATKDNGGNIHGHVEEHTRDILYRLCNSLCHLVVLAAGGGDTEVISTSHDSPVASARDLVHNAKQLFQRALNDSKFVFARLLWQTFIHIARNERGKHDHDNGGSSGTSSGSGTTYKPALIYAQSIFDLVPSAYFPDSEKNFFEDEMKTLRGGMTPSDLQQWLESQSVTSPTSVQANNPFEDPENFYSSDPELDKLESIDRLAPDGDKRRSPFDGANRRGSVGMRHLTSDTRKSFTDSSTGQGQMNMGMGMGMNMNMNTNTNTNTNMAHTNDITIPPQPQAHQEMNMTQINNHDHGIPQPQYQIDSTAGSNSNDDTLLYTLRQSKGRTSSNSLERRIEDKQKGKTRPPSPKSESSGPGVALIANANEEAARIDRRIAAKTSGHYGGDLRPVSAFAKAKSTFSNASDSSNSGVLFQRNTTTDKVVGYKSGGDNFVGERIEMKQRRENSDSSLGFRSESSKNDAEEQGLVKEKSRTSVQSANSNISASTKESEEADRLERRIAAKTSGHAVDSNEMDSSPSSEMRYLPRMSPDDNERMRERQRSIPDADVVTSTTEALINLSNDNPPPTGGRTYGRRGSLTEHSVMALNQSGTQDLFTMKSDFESGEEFTPILSTGQVVPQGSLQVIDEKSALVHNGGFIGSDSGPDFQHPGEETGIAVAKAVESELFEETDDAVLFDPKSNRRRMNRTLLLWTCFGVIAAISVAVALGILLTKNSDVFIEDITPTSAPTTDNFYNLKQHVETEFGMDKPYRDMQSPYGKAFFWLTKSDIYTWAESKKLEEFESSVDNSTLISALKEKYFHDVTVRYLFALLYYETSGDQWVTCSSVASLSDDKDLNCSYINRDSEPVHTKKRWLSPSHVCSWAGITCDEIGKTVLHIELSKSKFILSYDKKNNKCSISPIDIAFPYSDELRLFGTIPSELSKLEDLEYLTMFNNTIVGQIPPEIGKLTKLQILDLYSNFLSGEIPEELYDLTSLVYIHLGTNGLNGTISDNIQNMRDLQTLYLPQNNIGGKVPATIGELGTKLGKFLFLVHKIGY